MDYKAIVSVFAVVFPAELGDKTQPAILGLAAESKALVSVLIGAAAAMILATVLAVVLGGVISTYIPAKAIHVVAGSMFIVIGILMLAGRL